MAQFDKSIEEQINRTRQSIAEQLKALVIDGELDGQLTLSDTIKILETGHKVEAFVIYEGNFPSANHMRYVSEEICSKEVKRLNEKLGNKFTYRHRVFPE